MITRPRLSLRGQLLLVALPLALLLPWAGWQLLREVESLLRQGEEQALLATAATLARAITTVPAAVPPAPPTLFVQALPRPPQLDGETGDWQDIARHRFSAGDGASTLALALGRVDDALYLLVEAGLRAPRPADAHWPIAARSDHLLLALDGALGALELRLGNAADGPLRVVAADGGPAPLQLRGAWRATDAGFVAEWQLPQGLWPERLGLQLVDVDADSRPHRLGTGTAAVPATWPLLRTDPRRARPFAALLPAGVRARLLSAEGWILAEAGDPAPVGAATAVPWWRRQLYQQLLHAGDPLAGDDAGALRSDGPEVRRALGGEPAAAWRRDRADARLLLSAAVPLQVGASVHGVLQLERERQTLLLAERALGGLLMSTVLALAAAGLLLLLFASRLGLRIRRLRDASQHALQRDGRLRAVPASDAADEIGDLSRSISRLLGEIAESQDYLRSLAGKLSHELNTPLAIVRGALDNIDARALAASDRACVERARSGGERLAAIVRAMSEAGRIEQAIAAAEAEDVDLAALLRDCAAGYRSLLAPRELRLDLPSAPLYLHVAPELLVQALDKLVDNARDFTAEDGRVRIALEAAEEGALIRVANIGPPLPPIAPARLFESMVGVRDERRRGVHLGFGLYLVRLVAELHRGGASARNLPDGSGVEFELRLRALPRSR